MEEQIENNRIIPVSIEQELQDSFLNYAMSVIVSRALPDVRDGLKPVHRRILYAMHEMGIRSNLAHKKSSRIVGEVLGKFHPHGEAAIYESLVRLGQDFSLRYPVIHGQGNFGSIDGDPPAASRYTEARMHRVAEEMLRDIDKESVDFIANYDDSLTEPVVLPTAFPFLLANGANGIAVGMATNIPPHNLHEIANAVAAIVENPDIPDAELIKHIPGPDFPTGGIIHGRQGIYSAYKHGSGKIVLQARTELVELKNGKSQILIDQIPYAVNKAELVKQIAELVRDKRIQGIENVLDESDREGLRVVINLKRNTNINVVFNQLYKHSRLQVKFAVNSLALVNGRPEILPLRDMLRYFIEHRKEVLIRRTTYLLRKAREREHILDGLRIALASIEEVISVILAARTAVDAQTELVAQFEVTEIQAKAILDMRLYRLSSLEVEKIIEELRVIRVTIKEYVDFLADEKQIFAEIVRETHEIAKHYGDERKTKIVADEIREVLDEELIQKQTDSVTISSKGYIRRVVITAYRKQKRGGKGSMVAKKQLGEDYISHLLLASSHSYVLLFSTFGKAYWIRSYLLPETSKNAKGAHINTIFSLEANEGVASIVACEQLDETEELLFITRKGIVKRVNANVFRNAKRRGIIAIKLDEGDELVQVLSIDAEQDIIFLSREGMGLRIHANALRSMGRNTRGVCGIRLKPGDALVGASLVHKDTKLFLVTENGYGKRTHIEQFAPHNRGTGGQRAYKLTEKTGKVMGILPVADDDSCLLITVFGKGMYIHCGDVSLQSRTSSGISVVSLDEGDMLVAFAQSTDAQSTE